MPSAWARTRASPYIAYAHNQILLLQQVLKTVYISFSVGFVLYFKDEPILGYCVDSGFKEDVYEFFFQASTVIVDAREKGSKEHASVRQ